MSLAASSSSRAAACEGLRMRARRSTCSSSARVPSSGTASLGGTSRSTSVGTFASSASRITSSTAGSGSCDTSVVTRSAVWMVRSWWRRMCCTVVSLVAPGAM